MLVPNPLWCWNLPLPRSCRAIWAIVGSWALWPAPRWHSVASGGILGRVKPKGLQGFLHRFTSIFTTYGYGSIPINTIFRGMNIHKSQLFWCEQKGYKVLTHCHMALAQKWKIPRNDPFWENDDKYDDQSSDFRVPNLEAPPDWFPVFYWSQSWQACFVMLKDQRWSCGFDIIRILWWNINLIGPAHLVSWTLLRVMTYC